MAGRPILTWVLNIGRTIRGIFLVGETHLRHNLPGRAYLDPIQQIMVVMGLFRRSMVHLFLWLWLIVMLLPTIMSGDAPHFGRMTGAAPVLAIFCGYGFHRLHQFVSTKWEKSAPKPLLQSAWSILLFVSLGLTWMSYFNTYANHPRLPNLVDGFICPIGNWDS